MPSSRKPAASKAAPTVAKTTSASAKPASGEKKGNYNPRRKIHTLDPAASKAPKPTEVRVKQLFKSLCAQIDGGHPANAIKTCDKLLRLTPDDPDVLQTKLYLLLQTDQYSRALEMVDSTLSGAGSSKSSAELEKAYILYRMHKEQEAKAIVDASKAKDDAPKEGFAHLEAQLSYRMGEYDAAKQNYERILDDGSLDTEGQNDVLTNLSAIQSHIDFLQSGFYDSLRASGVSVTQLEDAPAPAPPSSATTILPTSVTAPTPAAAPAAAPKGPRKGRLPKHVVLGVTPLPDPERWIKKRERTYVTFGQGRKGKGKGKKEGATAGYSQGVSVAPAVSGVMEGGGSGSGHIPKSGGNKGRKKK